MNDDLAKKQKIRFEVLEQIYRLSDGITGEYVRGGEVADNLNLDKRSAISAFDYLLGQYLIERTDIMDNYGIYTITHDGINTIEGNDHNQKPGSTSVPQTINIMNVDQMTGSTIQQGTNRSSQNIHMSDEYLSDVRSFVNAFDQATTKININSELKLEIDAELKTILSQINSPKPKVSIIRECLESLRTIIESGIGGAIGSTLASQLPVLLSQLPSP